MIKLIATDIDGTLVPDGSDKINPEIFEVIMHLKKQGIYFVVASGRQWKSIERLFMPIKDAIFYIAENGAYVGARGRELFTVPMKQEDVYEIVKQVRELGTCEVMVSGKDVIYIDSKNPVFIDYLINGYHNEVEQVKDLLMVKEEFIKVSIYHQGYQAYEAAGVVMEKNWGGKLKVVTAGKEWLDIMEKGVNKGAALNTIQESLEIFREETMAFGDNLNDLELLAAPEESYAIGNAREEVKKAAKYVTDTNVNDGVLKEIRKLVIK